MNNVKGDNRGKPISMGGTFSANPLVIHAAEILSNISHWLSDRILDERTISVCAQAAT